MSRGDCLLVGTHGILFLTVFDEVFSFQDNAFSSSYQSSLNPNMEVSHIFAQRELDLQASSKLYFLKCYRDYGAKGENLG